MGQTGTEKILLNVANYSVLLVFSGISRCSKLTFLHGTWWISQRCSTGDTCRISLNVGYSPPLQSDTDVTTENSSVLAFVSEGTQLLSAEMASPRKEGSPLGCGPFKMPCMALTLSKAKTFYLTASESLIDAHGLFSFLLSSAPAITFAFNVLRHRTKICPLCLSKL